MPLTEELAHFNLTATADHIPQEVLHQGKRCLINYIAVAVYASRDSSLQRFLEVVNEEGITGRSTVLGSTSTTTLQNAPLINGFLGHLEDYDDTHFPTVIHPASPTIPAALAVGEKSGTTGLEFLVACTLGMELCCRIGLSFIDDQYNHCWHQTGTAGVFGSAMAAGRLLGLNQSQMVYATGIAATQASGLREGFGTMTKPFHAGRASQSGLLAALLAQAGFNATTQAIEGDRGFAKAFSGDPQLSRVSEQMGQRWELLSVGLKLHSCGMATHSLIDAGIGLRKDGVTPEAVASMVARVHPTVIEKVNRRHPASGLEGKFSLHHCIAVGLADGAALPEQFSDRRVNDPAIGSLRERITAQEDAGFSEEEALLRATLVDGRTLTKRVVHPTGDPENPVTDSQLEGKFRALVGVILPKDRMERLLDRLWNVDSVTDITEVLELTKPQE